MQSQLHTPLTSFLQDRHALGQLIIEINLVKETKSFLEIKDNGVGIHPKILMDSMTTFGSSTLLKFSVETLVNFCQLLYFH
jgi:HSP90 family molecular chaperone